MLCIRVSLCLLEASTDLQRSLESLTIRCSLLAASRSVRYWMCQWVGEMRGIGEDFTMSGQCMYPFLLETESSD